MLYCREQLPWPGVEFLLVSIFMMSACQLLFAIGKNVHVGLTRQLSGWVQSSQDETPELQLHVPAHLVPNTQTSQRTRRTNDKTEHEDTKHFHSPQVAWASTRWFWCLNIPWWLAKLSAMHNYAARKRAFIIACDAHIDNVGALAVHPCGNKRIIQTAPNWSMLHPAKNMTSVSCIIHLDQITDMSSVHFCNGFTELWAHVAGTAMPKQAVSSIDLCQLSLLPSDPWNSEA